MSNTIAITLPDEMYAALKQAAEKKQKSESELVMEAVETYLTQPQPRVPMLGLFADEPELIDELMETIMHNRETIPWRVNEPNNE